MIDGAVSNATALQIEFRNNSWQLNLGKEAQNEYRYKSM
jgi:hypothetical protein